MFLNLLKKNLENRRKVSSGKSFVLWFTGLSGAGKSTMGDMMYRYLANRGYRVERLDGDLIRSIFPGTGFSRSERNDHIKRVGFMASLLERNDVIVIASFVSPYAESRNFVREQCRNFIEVYLSAPLNACESRDVKGLYEKARGGKIQNFTGISDPYENPDRPELELDSSCLSIEQTFEKIRGYLVSRQLID